MAKRSKKSHATEEELKWDALVERAETELVPEDLSGEIEDLHEQSARDVNRGGVTYQIDYLVENYGVDYTEQVLTGALPRQSNPSGTRKLTVR